MSRAISNVNYKSDLCIESKVPFRHRRKINLRRYRAYHAKN